MKRLMAVLVAALLAVSLAGFEGAHASPTAVGAGAAPAPPLSWTPCGSDQCADFAVRLDYANPDTGPANTITLAVRRRLHTGAPFLGTMLTNPGGPGGSGTGLVALADYLPGGVGHQYDWVGFDPRGVGDSVPALRCNPNFFGANRPSFVPRTHRLMRFWRTKTNRYAARCGASAATRLLPHMTTLDTVRDMESLRAALEAENPLVGPKLNFYGFSYGSYLGQVYATQYPTRVGRFVLDGVVDPTNYWYGSNLQQEKGFDRNLNVFFRWIARHPGAFHLGRSWRDIRRGYYAELRRLDRRPAYHRLLGPDELTDAMLNAGYYVYDWNFIASAYSRLIRTGRGGQVFGIYANSNMGDDNGYAVYLGVQCTDVRRPAWRKQVRDAWRIHRRHPFLAWDNTWFNAPCVRWPAPSHARLGVSGSHLAAKILLVNETLDAATPYSGALRVRSLFPSASLIAGVGGTTHAGSLSGVGCVDNAISAYFAHGTVPTRLAGTRADRNCPKVPPPTATGARVAGGGGGLPAWLRAELTGAQWTALG